MMKLLNLVFVMILPMVLYGELLGVPLTLEGLSGGYLEEMMDSCFILSAKILVIRRQYYWEKVIPEKLFEVPEVLEVHVVPSDEVRMVPEFPTAMKILSP